MSTKSAQTKKETKETKETKDSKESQTTAAAKVTPISAGIPIDPATLTINTSVLEIDPALIVSDPQIKALRDWNGGSAQELKIPELARTIFEEGQKVPAIVRQTSDGLVMVDGERRRAAIQLIRENVDGLFGDGPNADFPLQIVIQELDENQALRATMLAFTQHADLEPVQYARSIGFIREKLNLKGGNHTAAVADFLGVSPATITQYERMLTVENTAPEAFEKIKTGQMSATAGMDLTVSPAEKQPEVAKVAEGLAAKDHAKKVAEKLVTPKGAKVTPGADGPTAREIADQAAKSDKPAAPPKIESKHIRQAQRLVEGALTKPRAPKMNEAVGLFEQWTGPAYPNVMAKFAGVFVDWSRGKLNSINPDKVLEAAWDDVADQISEKLKQKTEIKAPVKTAPAVKASTPAKKSAPKPVAKPIAKPITKPAGKPVVKPAAKKAMAAVAGKKK